MQFTLTFHETPKSLNRSTGGGKAGVPWPYIKEKTKWEGNFQIALMVEQVPRRLSRATATARLRFPSNRKRDEGNFRFILEKALGDTLVGGGWLPEDTPDHYSFGEVTFDSERGKALTVVTLEVEG